jgi:diadenosine tetraphosphatase ApaH/serine/threonine PP2A family protein phosphatase
MLALISDIHGNFAALQAVLDDIDSLGTVQRIYCLGDVIGYGPQPLECLRLTIERTSGIIMGNHEHAVVHGPYLFNANARKAIEWTREQLAAAPDGERLLGFLADLPIRLEVEDLLLVHGSPRDPVMEYVLESDLWEGADPKKMLEIFAAINHLCFVGHSHRPGIFTEDRCFLSAAELGDGFVVSDGKYLVNVGSVGQPRDRDPRACYTLFSGNAVYFRRVPYDIDSTAKLIEAVPELGQRSAQRLYRGE